MTPNQFLFVVSAPLVAFAIWRAFRKTRFLIIMASVLMSVRRMRRVIKKDGVAEGMPKLQRELDRIERNVRQIDGVDPEDI